MKQWLVSRLDRLLVHDTWGRATTKVVDENMAIGESAKSLQRNESGVLQRRRPMLVGGGDRSSFRVKQWYRSLANSRRLPAGEHLGFGGRQLIRELTQGAKVQRSRARDEI